jgi:hypothetical protein
MIADPEDKMIHRFRRLRRFIHLPVEAVRDTRRPKVSPPWRAKLSSNLRNLCNLRILFQFLG